MDNLLQTKKRRKRKRRRHNQETSNPCEETGSTGTNEEVMQEEVTPKCEIEHESLGKDLTLTPDLLKKPVEIVRSGSHRAGFDAFMTGFILSTYISQYGSYTGKLQLKDLGVDQMKNAIYLTAKDHPLMIVKSSFSKTSKEHKEKFMKLKVGRPMET